MIILSIVHGDDADGLTCGAFLKRVKGGEVYLANYDSLENALQKGFRAIVLEPIMDNDGPVLRETKQARLRVSVREVGGHRADLIESEAKAARTRSAHPALIPTGGHTDRIGQAHPCDCALQPRITVGECLPQ